jgi:large subunit ribosomal protein L19
MIDPKTITSVNTEERKKILIRAGDTVRVHQKIEEKGKTRIQIFEGLVLARKHGTEPGATFTVRATMSGIGVEKVFPLYSPLIDKIEVVRRSKVRRAKLYYIRDKVAREIRRQLRNMVTVNLSTTSEREEADKLAKQMEAEATKDAEVQVVVDKKEA